MCSLFRQYILCNSFKNNNIVLITPKNNTFDKVHQNQVQSVIHFNETDCKLFRLENSFLVDTTESQCNLNPGVLDISSLDCSRVVNHDKDFLDQLIIEKQVR